MKTFEEIITFADTPTGSDQQIYPKDTLIKAFDIYMGKDRCFRYGCLDAPEGGIIKLDKISHHLLDVWFEGNTLMGKIEVASTPMGNVLGQLIDSAPETLTLGLAAMAAFGAIEAEVISRDLFEVYEPEHSTVVDDIVVIGVYVLPKSQTNH